MIHSYGAMLTTVGTAAVNEAHRAVSCCKQEEFMHWLYAGSNVHTLHLQDIDMDADVDVDTGGGTRRGDLVNLRSEKRDGI